jgi:hypothetical protein
MLGHVALVRTDVSEELSASFIILHLVTLMKEALSYFETSVLTGATRGNIPEDAILVYTLSIKGPFEHIKDVSFFVKFQKCLVLLGEQNPLKKDLGPRP